MNPSSGSRRIVFQYMVPVHVEVENGDVHSVTIVDETPISSPTLVEGDPADFTDAVQAAYKAETWPSWRFGY